MHEGLVKFVGVPALVGEGMVWRAECTVCAWHGKPRHVDGPQDLVAPEARDDAREHEADPG